jgi:hypothetical protein
MVSRPRSRMIRAREQTARRIPCAGATSKIRMRTRANGRSKPEQNPGRHHIIREAAKGRDRKIPGGCCVQLCLPNYARPRLSRDGGPGRRSAGRTAIGSPQRRSPLGGQPGRHSGGHGHRRRTRMGEPRRSPGQGFQRALKEPSSLVGPRAQIVGRASRYAMVIAATGSDPPPAFGSAATDARCHE